MTYPSVLFLRTKVLGGPGDNFHFLWELWYVAHALFDLHKSPFFDPDVFVPFGFSLIRNQDLSPGTVLLFSPLTHFFGEVFTYNFLVLASFPLTAFGTYLLARELWSNRLAAVLAGIIVGFCPYRFAHAAGHLSIVSTEWIPFFFLFLERLISRLRLKNAVLGGVFFGLSALPTWPSSQAKCARSPRTPWSLGFDRPDLIGVVVISKMFDVSQTLTHFIVTVGLSHSTARPGIKA